MAVRDNIHSKVVFWLKITLPLLALAILSTLFLFSRRIETDGALPYSEVDVEQLAREQRLTDPEYSTMTEDGSALRVSADLAFPQGGSDGGGSADALIARYDMPGGMRIDLWATTGRLDQAGQELTLREGVQIDTSDGYHMMTHGLDAALDRTHMISEGSVIANGPMGRIDAGQMEMRLSDAENDGYVLIFNKGVKLVYQPAN